MMDKKDLKKKRKSLNGSPDSMSDKENIKRKADAGNKSNIDDSLISASLKPSRKDADSDRLLQVRNFNYLTPEYNSRKRSNALLVGDDFLSDITNESYWQDLAENDRDALASALTENRDLHNRITELEDENIRLKALLDEARSLVEVLTELLEEEGEDSLEEKSDDSFWDDL